MADITNDIQKIGQAVYGEEVRGAIMDALEAMNEQAAAAQEWATGQDDPTAEPSATNNAEYWAAQAAAAATSGPAALANEAQTFSASTAYTAGAYVLYNSVLYRFKTDHAAGAWTGTDAVAVKISGEVGDLKKANGNMLEQSLGYIPLAWEQGTLTNSGESASTKFIRTGYYPVAYGNTIAYSIASGYGIRVFGYSLAEGTYGNLGDIQGDGFLTITTSGVAKVRFRLNKTDSAAITPSVGYANATIRILGAGSALQQTRCSMQLEHGSYSTSDSNRFGKTNGRAHKRNKYAIMVNGASSLIIGAVNGTAIICDASGTILATQSLSTTGLNIITPDSSAVYIDFDFSGVNADSIPLIGYGGTGIAQGKRIYRNSGDTIVQDIDVVPDNSYYTCMAYKLPPNYSATGAKVPVVLWLGGNKSYSQITNGFVSSSVTGVNYLRDEGFAVVQVFGWGSVYYSNYPGCGKDMPYPVPVSLRCIEAGLKTLVDEYNVDGNNIHIVCRSFGGQMGLYYALMPLNGMRSVTMFDPVIDFLSMRGRFSDARKALVDELGMVGSHLTDFYDINEDGTTETGIPNYYFSERCQPVWEDNPSALIRLNVAWNHLTDGTFANNYASSLADSRKWWADGKYEAEDIYTHDDYHVPSMLPVKLCGASDDSDTPHQIYAEKIAQLRNAGNPAEIYMVPSGGHDAVSVDTTYAETVTTALNIVCADVPIGWIKAVEWIRRNS